ncbi:Hypothetical protein CINCED_3A023401 [Cinara cedri]|uniref:Uncharacterized protein n=1 Tax=Cinara cedri TaxID=506608 RepID=A0A5E4MM70_9HEMI|nr:Hypothetical protein CINCED_3A023401 [Cinara cedri]
MWLWFVTACSALVLSPDTVSSDAGLSSTSFSNELRAGFTRLFQNGIEQPNYQSPFVLLNPTEFQTPDPQLQRPAPFSAQFASPGYQPPRSRYHPSRGNKRPNDVLVLVVKTTTNSNNCTTNGTEPAAGDGGDEESNPDDEVEVIAGGAEKGKEPSRCVWAILSCCAPANTPIRYTCFDVLGCSAAFWDTNPCVPAILLTALDQATAYYGAATASNRTVTTDKPAADPAATDPPATDAAAVDLTAALTAGTTTTTADTSIIDQTATPKPAA